MNQKKTKCRGLYERTSNKELAFPTTTNPLELGLILESEEISDFCGALLIFSGPLLIFLLFVDDDEFIKFLIEKFKCSAVTNLFFIIIAIGIISFMLQAVGNSIITSNGDGEIFTLGTENTIPQTLVVEFN